MRGWRVVVFIVVGALLAAGLPVVAPRVDVVGAQEGSAESPPPRFLDAGFYHSLALQTDGTMWSWGGNSFGQLGDGTTTNRSTPVQVPGLTEVTAVGGGGNHSLAARFDGTVWAWGWNAYGQLGDASTATRTRRLSRAPWNLMGGPPPRRSLPAR